MTVQAGLCRTCSETTLLFFSTRRLLRIEAGVRQEKSVQCGGSSLTNEKDHHYFLNRFVCVGEFFDG